MADLSRIDKTFYRHPKAVKARAAEPGSISLWLFSNCWCRNHRRQGVIPVEEALALGSEAEIQALVDAGLWRRVGDDYVFKDWQDWNPDMARSNSTSSAAYIVARRLPNHPKATQDRLADEVLKLIDEGVPRRAIEAGLDKWGSRANARFAWLSYYVSDSIREGECGIYAAIKEARKTWNMAPLAEFGHKWVSPDLPDGMRSPRQVREYMRERKAEWLDGIEANLGSDNTTQ